MSTDFNEEVQAVSLCIQAGVTPLLWGPPGIGKTSVVTQIAGELNLAHFETLIASIRDPIDFGGVMVPHDGGVSLAVLPWAERVHRIAKDHPERKVLVFFDEITTAPPAVQAALLRVLLDRTVGDLYLGDNVVFAAAANPPEQAANGSDACAPLANRVCHLEWSLDYETWCTGILSGFPCPSPVVLDRNLYEEALPSARAKVSAFIRVNPGSLHKLPDDDVSRGQAWPSPRTWDMAARLLAAVTAVHGASSVRSRLITGCVGKGVGLQFLAWEQALDLPDPEDVLAHPSTAKVPDRGDKAFAVLGALQFAVCTPKPDELARWKAAWVYLDRVAEKLGDDVIMPCARALSDFRSTKPETEASKWLPDNRKLILRIGGFLNMGR